jgi:hypothetical protein
MALHSPSNPSKSLHPYWLTPALALLTAATLMIGGSEIYQRQEQTLLVNDAYQTTHQVITRYFTAVEARERAIREANPDKVARIEQSLTQDRKALVDAIRGYIVAIARLPDKEMAERFGTLEMEGAVTQRKIQVTIRSFEGVGRLVHLKVADTPDEWNQRHLNFWLSGGEQPQAYVLNDFSKDPDTIAEQLALLNAPDTPNRFLVVAGKRASLGGVSPWLEVFQVQKDHLENKTAQVFPQTLLKNTLGASPAVQPSNYIRLERYVLDPERVMAPCDSCGLLAYRTRLQWSDGRYQLIENTPLNTADNASYAGFLYLKKREQTPTWAKSFLSASFRSQVNNLPPFQPKRYASWNQGFVLDNSDLQNKAAATFSFTGVADAKLIVQKNAQGQWQVQNLKSEQGNFWNAPAPSQ